MRLEDLAKQFPQNPEQWHHAGTSWSLPLHFRVFLKQKVGQLVHTTDISRMRAPTRFGIALRPYQLGDPLKALSRPHLMRSNEMQTKTDAAEGRRRMGVVLHLYKNMEYRSPQDSVNRGQVALCLGSLLKSLFTSLSFETKIFLCFSQNPAQYLNQNARALRSCNHLYMVTDLFHNPEDLNASSQDIYAVFKAMGIRNYHLFLIRTLWESLHNNALRQQELHLSPYSGNSPQDVSYYSGQRYVENLAEQYYTAQALFSKSYATCHIVQANYSLEETLDIIHKLFLRPL